MKKQIDEEFNKNIDSNKQDIKPTPLIMKNKTYQERVSEILTPEVIERMEKARQERFDEVIKSLEDQDELFLEQVKEWIEEYLQECYSYSD